MVAAITMSQGDRMQRPILLNRMSHERFINCLSMRSSLVHDDALFDVFVATDTYHLRIRVTERDRYRIWSYRVKTKARKGLRKHGQEGGLPGRTAKTGSSMFVLNCQRALADGVDSQSMVGSC